jgi:hypothetical protein
MLGKKMILWIALMGSGLEIMVMYADDAGRRGAVYHRTLEAGPFFDSVRPLSLRGALDGGAF